MGIGVCNSGVADDITGVLFDPWVEKGRGKGGGGGGGGGGGSSVEEDEEEGGGGGGAAVNIDCVFNGWVLAPLFIFNTVGFIWNGNKDGDKVELAAVSDVEEDEAANVGKFVNGYALILLLILLLRSLYTPPVDEINGMPGRTKRWCAL